jgi:TrmH family RNA methyltransferase
VKTGPRKGLGKGKTGVAAQNALIQRFREARRDRALAVLEGFHPIKHALRFGAEILETAVVDPEPVERLAATLGPDIAAHFRAAVETVPAEIFDELSPTPPATGVIALARRPEPAPEQALAALGKEPVIFLERPASLWNIGAAVRVAAAAGAAGLFTTGIHDPWHPHAIRGAAGLQYALPVAHLDALPPSDRPIIAIHPDGEPLTPGAVPPRAILAFGTERHGLSHELLGQADARLAIPMRPGVSSLNLATAVAVTLYLAFA